jgi:hypothetical protein
VGSDGAGLKHDPEKCVAVFRQDHAHQRDKGWDRQTRKKPAVPCRHIEIAGLEVRLRGPAWATARP